MKYEELSETASSSALTHCWMVLPFPHHVRDRRDETKEDATRDTPSHLRERGALSSDHHPTLILLHRIQTPPTHTAGREWQRGNMEPRPRRPLLLRSILGRSRRRLRHPSKLPFRPRRGMRGTRNPRGTVLRRNDVRYEVRRGRRLRLREVRRCRIAFEESQRGEFRNPVGGGTVRAVLVSDGEGRSDVDPHGISHRVPSRLRGRVRRSEASLVLRGGIRRCQFQVRGALSDLRGVSDGGDMLLRNELRCEDARTDASSDEEADGQSHAEADGQSVGVSDDGDADGQS
mmetsp:Transcript_2343/g.5146  ORF Transcript_2343/g.5146 Transcript_2343/m.5146 type:complete len:288 (+) Transcript_2343:224-1087(+)